MKNAVKTLLVTLVVSITAPTAAFAATTDVLNAGQYCQGAAASSAVCQDSKKPTNNLTGSNGIILKVADLLAIVAGAAAVIMIIINGLKMVTSNGNSEGFASARRGILYALVGLVVIALSRAIVGLVLTKL